MLSLEAAIEKIKQLPPEEQQEVFKIIEFIDFKNQQESQIENSVYSGQTTEKLEEEKAKGEWKEVDEAIEKEKQKR